MYRPVASSLQLGADEPVNVRRPGPIVQVAYVVEDLHYAIRQWITLFGVGPFFVLERVEYLEHEVDGIRSSPVMSLAFAYSGDLQVELIQTLDQEPSVISRYPPSPVNGFHHIAILSEDMASDEARMAKGGLRRVGSGVSEMGVRVAFFHGGPHAGGLVELIRADDTVTRFFRELKRAASEWDGKTPYGAAPG